jgi:hypothetical protein
VTRRIRRQAALGFRQLALAADLVAAAGLVPGHRDVDEPLEEVAFGAVGGAPRVLERLVGRKEFASADQVEAVREAVRDRVRRRP